MSREGKERLSARLAQNSETVDKLLAGAAGGNFEQTEQVTI